MATANIKQLKMSFICCPAVDLRFELELYQTPGWPLGPGDKLALADKGWGQGAE